jgi:hypothetical protein
MKSRRLIVLVVAMELLPEIPDRFFGGTGGDRFGLEKECQRYPTAGRPH